MTTFSIRVFRSPSVLKKRSWVIGRDVATFSIFNAIALASKTPIQIGRKNFSSASFSTTTGVFEMGSRSSPLISIFFIGPPRSSCRRPGERILETPLDPNRDVLAGADRAPGTGPEMDDPVARGPPGKSMAELALPFHQDIHD